MSEVQLLQAKAAQAERLARAVTDPEMIEKLFEIAREYKARAAALGAKLLG